MAAFSYQAIDSQGKQQKGVIEADTERQARQALRAKGLTPLNVSAVNDSAKKKTTKTSSLNIRFERKKLKPNELALLTRQLSTLLAAGIPLDEALTGVAEQSETEKVKSVILGVRAKVLEGHKLATGLAAFPKAFPHLYVTTVASGEQSGKLDLVLERLADYTEQQNTMRQKVRQALIYPIVMSLVSICVVVFMLIYVVPRIVHVFTQTKMTLPMSTQILLAASGFLESYGIYLLIVILLGTFLFRYFLRKNKDFRRRVHATLLKMPVIGKNIRFINCARYARTLGILTSASVPVLDAMRAASDLITMLPMQESVSAAIDKVREGGNISTALQQTKYFPPMFIHLIASGEASGKLEAMLERAADNQDSDVNNLMQNSLTLFEPMLILVMGGVVLFIVLAVLLPIFSLDTMAN